MNLRTEINGKSELLIVLGGVSGLIAGGYGSLFVAGSVASAYSSAQRLLPFVRHMPQAWAMLGVFLCLYTAWLFLSWLLTRKVGMIFWALVAFPLPSLAIAYLMARDL